MLFCGASVLCPPARHLLLSAIHTLAKDEEVVATVAGDLLRRPAVVAQMKPADKVTAVEERDLGEDPPEPDA
ncbi:DUF6192 family protein [Streptomyces sp. NPDC088387]|uniref:DUF6192 family protein n=1 Tax=Streptomyces sp. NPDC088387 TaxID=3365859 RepID=UPI0038234333